MSMSFQANGNIVPARFVKLDTSQPGGFVLQCGAGDKPIGVAQHGTHYTPLQGLDDGYAAVQGLNLLVHTEKDECYLESGGVITVNDYLKPNASGQGITSSTDGDFYGAVALQNATAAGQLIRCKVQLGMRGA